MSKRNNENPGNTGKWYDKFSKKPVEKKTAPEKKQNTAVIEAKKEYSKKFAQSRAEKMNIVLNQTSMFDANKIPLDASKILSNFSDIIQNVQPLNSKQLAKVPLAIRDLSHELTDERSERYRSYMNETVRLSAYVRYYMWWNLVRLTRLFSSFDSDFFCLKDDDVCLDIGSGPLTVVIALWLSRPELRKKKLTWYCLDISQSSMSLGEEIYLSIAAKTLVETEDSPWKIVRVRGEMGTSIKQKAAFVTCANMFNELLQHSDMPPDYSAKKYSDMLLSYAKEKSAILVIEPGVPRSARLISLMRDAFMRKDFMPISPCPHYLECPMEGKKGGKWCNYAFSTDDAPTKLLKLSEAAGIPKERAVLSYILVNNFESKKENKDSLLLRIASDPIKLPFHQSGFYACSELGLTLAINRSERKITSGDKIYLQKINNINSLPHDEKSGAIEVVL